MNSVAFIRPAWSPASIAVMVLGFVIWWPLGLAMLAYIMWGEKYGPQIGEAVRQTRSGVAGFKNATGFGQSGFGTSGFTTTGFAKTGNAAFDAHREQELARLNEERRKLDAERSEFEAFLANLHMARDKEEFDRFMADRRKTVDE